MEGECKETWGICALKYFLLQTQIRIRTCAFIHQEAAELLLHIKSFHFVDPVDVGVNLLINCCVLLVGLFSHVTSSQSVFLFLSSI